jgi:hypothetical protein
LDGFGNSALIEAMTCVQNRRFVCWQQQRRGGRAARRMLNEPVAWSLRRRQWCRPRVSRPDRR